MVTVKELQDYLKESTSLHIMLPEGAFVPGHFHITEVGLVKKVFIDCGGIKRRRRACVLQVWTADDYDHKLTSDKLGKILTMAEPILRTDKLAVEIEYGERYVSQYPLVRVEVTPSGLLFVLGGKQTACLAPDKCGVSKCCGKGCC